MMAFCVCEQRADGSADKYMMKVAKRAVVLMLGILLVCQAVSNAFAVAGANASRAKACCVGCDTHPCASSACCAKPAKDTGEVPSTPARSSLQDECPAMAPLLSVVLSIPTPRTEPISS